MITIQIKKHKNQFVKRSCEPNDDKLMGEFTSIKEALKFYKTMGFGTTTHYFMAKEKGIPGIPLKPVSRHFKAVGEAMAKRGAISEERKQGGWKGGEV